MVNIMPSSRGIFYEENPLINAQNQKPIREMVIQDINPHKPFEYQKGI
jgi:hypothetical protein